MTASYFAHPMRAFQATIIAVCLSFLLAHDASAQVGTATTWNGHFVHTESSRRMEVSITRTTSGQFTTYTGGLLFYFRVESVAEDTAGNLTLQCVAGLKRDHRFLLTGSETLTGVASFPDLKGRPVIGTITLNRITTNVRDNRRFDLRFKRNTVQQDGTVIGSLSLNGVLLGSFFENDLLKIPAGRYSARLRYQSGKEFVQGPFGAMAKTGDFLMEIAGVPGRSHILLHSGTLAAHSEGCILLGAAATGADGMKYVVDPNGPLYQLRKAFYGTETPIATPVKQVTIIVED